MKNPANQNIQKMQPYCPPLENRQEYDGILLDFNEATVPISPKVQQALSEMVKINQFQLYPEYADFNRKLASYAGVKPSQIMVTNGSDQAIDIIFRTFIVFLKTIITFVVQSKKVVVGITVQFQQPLRVRGLTVGITY